MAKFNTQPLTKKDQEQILRMFKGTNRVTGIKNARKISEELNLPRARVMTFLNDRGLTSYKPSSYSKQ